MKRWLLLVLAVVSCSGRSSSQPDASTPECSSDGACVSQLGAGATCSGGHCNAAVNLACTTEEDCASLGLGHMCMNGGCMLMNTHAPVVTQPPPSEQDVPPTVLMDNNPDPDVFEATLVAGQELVELRSGQLTSAFVYKASASSPGRMTGPLIDVAVGQLVRIHFTNNLDEATSIHWHGIRLPVAMDGVPDMPTPAVQPGESFTYEFQVPDAALFWYHPHFHADEQIERGLYGMLVVRDAQQPAVDRERFLSVDDVLLDTEGAIVPADHGTAMEGNIMKFAAMMGRQGNLLLLNGRANPILHVKAGEVERWRIVNTANSRFFRLRLAGHQFIIIGVDGGLIPNPKTVDEVLLAPAERYDVLVKMTGAPGSEVPLLTHHFDRGHDMADPGDLPVAWVRYDAQAGTDRPLPTTTATIERLVGPAAPAHTLRMDETVLRGGKVGFTLNSELWPNVTPLSAQLGATETWALENATHMVHPVHLHGFRFQVLDRQPFNGTTVAEVDLAWKDTVIVQAQETLRFTVRYDGFAGPWMFHCHIFEHAENGMMGMINVNP